MSLEFSKLIRRIHYFKILAEFEMASNKASRSSAKFLSYPCQIGDWREMYQGV